MSSTAAERLKKVMRIALVGIRPADQVLLKGYLRILLRLEADLEWVSANSPQVDLFMINKEFMHAQSVQKVLATQHNVPALYVERDELDQGKLVGTTLTLPLKEIDLLNQWLFDNVQSLRVNGVKSPPFSSANNHANQPVMPSVNVPTTAPRQTLDDILAQRNQNTNNHPTTTSPYAIATDNPTVSQKIPTPIPTLTQKNHLVATLKNLQQRENVIYSLTQQGAVLAYINPKYQRVWVIDNTATLDTDWELSQVSENPPIVSQIADDLVHWLWQKSMTTPTPPPLLTPNERYRLTQWLKPLEDEHRHDILKIQALLDAKDSTLDEVTQIAQVSHELALRSISGFIVSGLMTPAFYDNLVSSLTIPMPAATSAMATHSPTQSYTPPIMTTLTPTTSEPLVNSSANNTPATVPTAQQDEGMKGFLSKLRRKLGL